jgi:hypothetical protein
MSNKYFIDVIKLRPTGSKPQLTGAIKQNELFNGPYFLAMAALNPLQRSTMMTTKSILYYRI